jgi:NAD(P)-dependent dehydrogenase (short-subunit alcohol dehydrogenase family)
MEVLIEAYGDEVKNISAIRTHIINPGATRTAMRAKAYPGEDPASLKAPEVVADAILKLILSDTPTGQRITIEG